MQLSTHKDISAAFGIIASQLARVKQIAIEQFKKDADKCETDFLSTLQGFGGGKMIRPALVLLSGQCCGKITDEHLRAAAIVEIIHNATLLHDDVIDQGQKRRGRPTVNFLMGNEYAVLMGDLLLSKASLMCAELPRNINSIIVSAGMTVCRGELRQTARKNDWKITEPEYLDIITEKSASLFSCCCRLGAVLADADEKKAEVLANFGLNVGIAFQITDDLLDITGDEKKTGKTLGSDAAENKPTLPLIHLLGTVKKDKKTSLIRSIAAKNAGKNSRAEIVKMLESAGSLAYAQEKAQQFARKAIKSLSGLPKNPARQALIETAEFSARRSN